MPWTTREKPAGRFRLRVKSNRRPTGTTIESISDPMTRISTAFSATDGKLIWKFRTDGPVHCTPSIDSGHIYVAGCDEISARWISVSGKEVYTLPLHAYMGASPVIRDGQVYVGTFGNEIIGIDLKKRTQLWTYRHPVRNFPFYSSAAVTSDKVVVGGRDKILHCLNRYREGSLDLYHARPNRIFAASRRQSSLRRIQRWASLRPRSGIGQKNLGFHGGSPALGFAGGPAQAVSW